MGLEAATLRAGTSVTTAHCTVRGSLGASPFPCPMPSTVNLTLAVHCHRPAAVVLQKLSSETPEQMLIASMGITG